MLLVSILNSLLHFSICPCTNSRQYWNLGDEIVVMSWQSVLFIFADWGDSVYAFSFPYLLLKVFFDVLFPLISIDWILSIFFCNLLIIWETLSYCNWRCSWLAVYILVDSWGELDFVKQGYKLIKRNLSFYVEYYFR